MGQYHKTVNLDKKQFINPHKLGDGAKLLEQTGHSPGGTNDALHMLLAVSSGRGGGDFQSNSPLIGSWGGDRIAVVGDYAEDGDLPAEFNASTIYHRCDPDADQSYQDITDDLKPIMEIEYEVVYLGSDRVSIWDTIAGFQSTHGIGDRIAEIDDKEYLMSDVRAALHKHAAKVSGLRGDGKISASELGLKPIKRKR